MKSCIATLSKVIIWPKNKQRKDKKRKMSKIKWHDSDDVHFVLDQHA